MSKLQPSHPFSRVGLVSIMPCGCISLPVTFGMPENFRMESILFDVVEANLPFNAILGRPTQYQFMVVAHYGYLVLKMPPTMMSSRSTKTVMQTSLHWRKCRHWQ
jgi:hypothetical protein